MSEPANFYDDAPRIYVDKLPTAIMMTLDPFDYVEPCQPNCTPEQHARHEGQWDMACKINEAMGKEPHP